MAFRITPAHEAQRVEFTISPAPGKEIDVSLPKLGYIPKPVADVVDAWTTKRFADVQKLRDDRNKKRLTMPDSDADTRYPSPLDVMDQMLEQLDPDAAVVIAGLSHGEREQIWEYWNEQSKPADAEKSSASSDSSDEKA
ncbi:MULTISPECIES: hypothetical protein [Bacteria]|uniref:hypothetical protein n=1 Tax=Bacteria TaxID=2 RepID=UPI0036D8D64E